MIPLKKKMMLAAQKPGLPFIVNEVLVPSYPRADNTLPPMTKAMPGDYLVLCQTSTSGTSSFTISGFTEIAASSGTTAPSFRVFIREVTASEPSYTFTSTGSGTVTMFLVRRSSGYSATSVNTISSGRLIATPSASTPPRGLSVGVFATSNTAAVPFRFLPSIYRALISLNAAAFLGSCFIGSAQSIPGITTTISLEWFAGETDVGAKIGVQIVFSPEEI